MRLFAKAPLAALVVLACLSAPSRAAHAQEFPDRPIRIVVPFTPGAAADAAVRLLQPALEKRLGQSLVIDYKTGAGGSIAAQEVARAKPDGHTLLMGGTNNFVIDQFMQARPSIDPLAAFVPVVKIVEVPAVLFASKGSQARNWSEFASWAARPGSQVNFGSPGIGTTPHLSSLLLARASGIAIVHVPFRGSQPAIQSLLADDIQLYMGNYQPLAQFVRQQRVVPLAVVAKQRLRALPDVPTVAEAGVPDVLANNWFALAAPSGTPPEAVARIAREVRAVIESPEMREKYADQGFSVSGSDGARLQEELRAEADRWRRLIANEKLAGRE